MSVLCRHIHLHAFLHDRFLLQAIGYHIADRNQFQIEFVRHFTQFGQTRHRAVFVHNLHERTGRIETGQAAHINRSFGMTGTAQHAFLLCVQRIDVSGTAECGRSRSRVGQRLNGCGTVGGRNTGRTTFQLIDCYRKGSTQYRGIIGHLMR